MLLHLRLFMLLICILYIFVNYIYICSVSWQETHLFSCSLLSLFHLLFFSLLICVLYIFSNYIYSVSWQGTLIYLWCHRYLLYDISICLYVLHVFMLFHYVCRSFSYVLHSFPFFLLFIVSMMLICVFLFCVLYSVSWQHTLLSLCFI